VLYYGIKLRCYSKRLEDRISEQFGDLGILWEFKKTVKMVKVQLQTLVHLGESMRLVAKFMNFGFTHT
jgi:hypothetical protein